MSSCPASPTQKARANLELDGLHHLGEVGAGEQQHADGDDEQHGEAAGHHLHRRDGAIGRRSVCRSSARAGSTGMGSELIVRISPSTIPLSASTRPPTESALPVT